MNFYFAPLEGITGYIYRNNYEKYFGGINKYFTPFIAPDSNCFLSNKEKRDVLPDNNNVMPVPQILTNKAKNFIGSAKALKNLGYTEVNLNLGCPAATVVTKHKGSGMLDDTDYLDEFLYHIFENTDIKISIKTRTGMRTHDEFYELLNIFNKYELSELIIHPRVREEYYNGETNLEIYEYALKNSKNKVIYNGDIHSLKDYEMFLERFRDTDSLMLGRGLLKNPGLINRIKGGDMKDEKAKIGRFMANIKDDYYEAMHDEKNVLFKMKELWLYLSTYFEDGETYWKKIKKVKNFNEYAKVVDTIF